MVAILALSQRRNASIETLKQPRASAHSLRAGGCRGGTAHGGQRLRRKSLMASFARRLLCGPSIRMCGAVALSGTAAVLCRRNVDCLSGSQRTHNIAGGEVLVSLPPSYESGVRSRRAFDVVYVIECGTRPLLFTQVVNAARDDHIAIVERDPKRNWHPEMIIAGIRLPPSTSTEALLEYVTEWAVPIVDATYETKPYAAGRAICGCDTRGGEVVRHMLQGEGARAKVFRFYLLGGDSKEGVAARGGQAPTTRLPDKTAVFLCGAEERIRPLAACVEERTAGSPTDTTMFVNRHGEQTYTQHVSSAGPAVTVDAVESSPEGVARALAEHGMAWLGERLEQQKLVSLGALMPWHEFK